MTAIEIKSDYCLSQNKEHISIIGIPDLEEILTERYNLFHSEWDLLASIEEVITDDYIDICVAPYDQDNTDYSTLEIELLNKDELIEKYKHLIEVVNCCNKYDIMTDKNGDCVRAKYCPICGNQLN